MKRSQMGQEKETPRVIRFLRDRSWLIIVGCLAVLAAAGLFLVSMSRRGDAEESLRAIDAAHIVSQEENAAGIYTELAWDPNLPSPDPAWVPRGVLSVTLVRPWRGVEFPQVAQWIDERQVILDALMEAARRPQCWFSVSEARWQGGTRSDAGSQWPLLLLQAANRDWGERRTDAGLEKLLCLFQMARHFLAQSSPGDYLLGVGMASTGLKRFARLVTTEEVPPEWLARLEAALPPVEDTLAVKSQQVNEVRALYEQEIERSLFQRLRRIFSVKPRFRRGVSMSDIIFLGECRAARILLALRRYRDDTGAWPTDLRALDTHLPVESLTDPFSHMRFVYRPARDGFLLYSVGLNGTDEGGRPPADFLFWPRR
jgi:hypothetical protein